MNIQSPPPQQLKLIFQGRLEFGGQRSFEKMQQHWHARIENYFKSDIILKPEEVLFEEESAMNIPRYVVMSTEKQWRNTVALLKELAQFAVAGQVRAWWVSNGLALDEYSIEPLSEKGAVVEYIRGCSLVGQAGMETEASAALSRAIEKFEKHALAYERRGYVNYKLGNYNDALYDFSKSINICTANAEPFYGRGKVKMLKNEWDSAVLDFDQAINLALAVQPIHWLARLRKGDCLYHNKRYAEAIPELKFYLQRKFGEKDPNLRFRTKAEFLLAECEKLKS
jgi:tetratricopeptide (TPR) repeat protein